MSNSTRSTRRTFDPNRKRNKPGQCLKFTMAGGLFWVMIAALSLSQAQATFTAFYLVKDIAPNIYGSYPSALTAVNGTLFFQANDASTGPELWKSDGTAAGTVLVKDIVPGPDGSTPKYLTNVNGTVFFSVDNGTGIRKLWKSDGTTAGTLMVEDINPGPASSGLGGLVEMNDTLFLCAQNNIYDSELWAVKVVEPCTGPYCSHYLPIIFK